MENENSLILVTWDFTNISQCALEHAVRISRSIKKDIGLFHVVPPKMTDKEIEGRKDKLNLVCEETERRFGIKPHIIIREGTIFNTISAYATENNTSLVVMGTHGIKGSQKFFGSWALKVIVGSSAPFIVVQDKPKTHEKYSNIVFPIDFKSENKEKLYWAIYFGKYFNSKVHLYKYPVNDKSLQKKINTNLNFAIRFLIQNNLEYEIHSPEKSKDFMQETADFANSINADLILIMTTKHITVLDYIFGAREQKIIANTAKIPVMCVNPKANFSNMGQFMFGQ
ncbi:MAG TPA: universal stress protein [Bacteroidales bacterium]|nr:universal stress protein [Bacteroidales bacterium]